MAKRKSKSAANTNKSPVCATPKETAEAREEEINSTFGPIKKIHITASSKRDIEFTCVDGTVMTVKKGTLLELDAYDGDPIDQQFSELCIDTGHGTSYHPIRFYHCGDTAETAHLRETKQKVDPAKMTRDTEAMVNHPWTYCDWDFGMSLILEDDTELSHKDVSAIMQELGYGWCSSSKEWATRSDGKSAGRSFGDGTALARKRIELAHRKSA